MTDVPPKRGVAGGTAGWDGVVPAAQSRSNAATSGCQGQSRQAGYDRPTVIWKELQLGQVEDDQQTLDRSGGTARRESLDQKRQA